MAFVPSIYQKDIYEFVRVQGDLVVRGLKPRNLMVNAGAGCAKTTTSVNSLMFIPGSLNVGFFAFNKDIVETLEKKVPKNCRVKTFHSAGYGAIRYRFKNVRKNDKKMLDIFKRLLDTSFVNLPKEETGVILSPFLKICGLIKNTMLEPTDSNIIELGDKYNVDMEDCDEETLFRMIREGMSISNSMVNEVDFDDMIYLPVKLKLSFFKLDIIFVDETQDLNSSQLSMLRMMIKDKGFIVVVGDVNQSIYGFRGADIDAMMRMKETLNCHELPLMETYRCGKNIVKLANEIVPELVAYSGNCEGKVEEISYENFYDLVKENDMVLCRNTAPLISPVFRLLGEGIKCAIKGRDIGEGLIKLVKKLKAVSIDDFYEKLEKWKETEEEKARRKKSDSMMQSTEDKYECLSIIAGECKTVSEIVSKIENIFSDSRAAITFSTVHKAKGDESDTVFILDPHLMPSKWAKKDWEILQEKNVMYVAITRAKENLYLVGGSIDTKFWLDINITEKSEEMI